MRICCIFEVRDSRKLSTKWKYVFFLHMWFCRDFSRPLAIPLIRNLLYGTSTRTCTPMLVCSFLLFLYGFGVEDEVWLKIYSRYKGRRWSQQISSTRVHFQQRLIDWINVRKLFFIFGSHPHGLSKHNGPAGAKKNKKTVRGTIHACSPCTLMYWADRLKKRKDISRTTSTVVCWCLCINSCHANS